MELSDQVQHAERKNRLLAWIALILLLAAWLVVFVGRERVSRLDVSRWGTDLDVLELLQIDKFRYQFYLPYIVAAGVLDVLALVAALSLTSGERFKILIWLVALIWLVSASFHGLDLFVTLIFAR